MQGRRIVSIVALGAALGLAAPRPTEAGFIATAAAAAGKGALSFLAEQAFEQAAGAIYRGSCGAATGDEVVTFLCDALGSASGVSEEEWRDQVSADLQAVREDLDFLKQGQLRIQQRIDDVAAQNVVLRTKIDELDNEVVLRPLIADIRNLWRERFVPLFQRSPSLAEQPRLRGELLAFADVALGSGETSLRRQLGRIDDVVSQPGTSGKAHLLQLYVERLQAEMARDGVSDVGLSYDWLESVLTELLFVQRQGYLMYLWAAEIRESECELDPACDPNRLPDRSAAYVPIFEENVGRQLDAFNSAVEWLVLANADVHSIDPNFLPAGGEEVFERLDFFTATNLGGDALDGVRGRVIAMDPRFNGAVVFDDRRVERARPVQEVAISTAGGEVDWWRWTGKTRYDELQREVRFASRWRVFRYRADMRDVGPRRFAAAFGRPLPYAPPFEVATWDRATGRAGAAPPDRAVTFGSFVGLHREGGGYALLGGEWSSTTFTASAETTAAERVMSRENAEATAPEDGGPGTLDLGLVSVGKINNVFNINHAFGKIEESRYGRVHSLSFFGYPEGGQLTLHVELEPGWIVCDACGDFARRESLMELYTDFQSTWMVPDPAFSARLAFVLGEFEEWTEDVRSANGLVITESFRGPGSSSVRVSSAEERSKSVPVSFVSGERYSPQLDASYSFSQSTRGADASAWQVLVQMRVRNAYLTKP